MANQYSPFLSLPAELRARIIVFSVDRTVNRPGARLDFLHPSFVDELRCSPFRLSVTRQLRGESVCQLHSTIKTWLVVAGVQGVVVAHRLLAKLVRWGLVVDPGWLGGKKRMFLRTTGCGGRESALRQWVLDRWTAAITIPADLSFGGSWPVAWWFRSCDLQNFWRWHQAA